LANEIESADWTIALVVRDYDEATRFCVETLGFELIEDRVGAIIDAAQDYGRPCTQEGGVEPNRMAVGSARVSMHDWGFA
jgi:catechol 2,3-dioxygenase-like lactoylglutathione lyase family enzyme